MATRRQSIPGTYRELLLDARRRGYGINEAGRRRLVRAFEHAMRELEEKSRSDNPLTRDRAQSMRRQLRELLDALSNETVKIITRTRDLTIEEILELHKRQALKLARAHGGPVRRIEARFDRLAVRAVGTLASRRQNAGVFKTLIKHDRIGAVRDLDRLIDAAVATGKSPARLTKDIAALLANDPSVKLGDYGLTKQRTAHIRTLYSDARRIAVTEVNNALREANTQALKASGLVTGATWQLSGRHHIEDECDDLANYTGWNGEKGAWPIDDWPSAPHPHCFPGDTLVEGAFQVGTVAQYRGDVITLRTAHQHELTVTPNHPVLTPLGFRRAAELRVGDQLIGRRFDVDAPTLAPPGHEVEMPRRAEEVIDFLRQSGGSLVRHRQADHLYGDAVSMEDEIEIVGTNGGRLRALNAAGTDGVGELLLELAAVGSLPGDSAGSSDLPSEWVARPASGGVGGGDEYLRIAALLLESLPELAAGVGLATDIDATADERPGDAGATSARLARDLQDRHPGTIALDEVVDLGSRNWRGHVYDFQTASGTIIANGVMISNCGCTQGGPVYYRDPEEWT